MKESKIKTIVFLNGLLMLYSLSGVFSKIASQSRLFSIKFVMCYGAIIVLLGIYAIGWQQVIKKLPLTTAFSNKAVTVVWGMIWGLIIFNEKISLGKVIGALLVMIGVVVYSCAGKENDI